MLQKFDSLVEGFTIHKKEKRKEKKIYKKKRMSNPTLISGFEDIIAHIKQQEQRIMNLEENEKVREARVQELYLENQKLKEDQEMYLSAVEAMKIGMEHKWDQKEKEWVSEEEYEERYGEEEWLKKAVENDPEQYGEAMARENFKSEEEYQEWLKNTPKEGIDY
jgi:hypothetical protein